VTDRTKRLARAALFATLAVGVIGAPTLAGKPTRDLSSATFWVDDGTYATTTTAHRGSSGAQWVHAKCSQNGTVVYEQWIRYGTAWTGTLTLGPTPSWKGGAASCWAEDGWWQNGTRWRVIATDAFAAAG